MVSLPLFFSAPDDQSLQDSLRHARVTHEPDYPVTRCLLLGPPRCGKTSLSFQYAYGIAEQGWPVVFLASQSKMNQAPPRRARSQILDPDALRRIDMKYIEDDASLRRYLASFHLLPTIPVAIVVDDISSFLSEAAHDRRARLAKTMALLVNAADHSTHVLEGQGHTTACTVVVTDTAYESSLPFCHMLLERWLPLVLFIKGQGTSYELVVQQINRHADPWKFGAQFALTPECVALHTFFSVAPSSTRNEVK